MAINFTDQTFGDRTVSAVDVGSDQIVLEDSLSAFDLIHVEAAMADDINTYEMPNGQLFLVYYAEFIRTAAELTAAYTSTDNAALASSISTVSSDLSTLTSTYNTHTHDAGAVGVPDQTV